MEAQHRPIAVLCNKVRLADAAPLRQHRHQPIDARILRRRHIRQNQRKIEANRRACVCAFPLLRRFVNRCHAVLLLLPGEEFQYLFQTGVLLILVADVAQADRKQHANVHIVQAVKDLLTTTPILDQPQLS